jgi:hypothetical protein
MALVTVQRESSVVDDSNELHDSVDGVVSARTHVVLYRLGVVQTGLHRSASSSSDHGGSVVHSRQSRCVIARVFVGVVHRMRLLYPPPGKLRQRPIIFIANSRSYNQYVHYTFHEYAFKN